MKDERTSTLLNGFGKQEEFRGSMLVDGTLCPEEVECRFSTNHIDTSDLKAEVVFRPKGGGYLSLFNVPRIGDVVVQSQKGSGTSMFQVKGYLKGQGQISGSRKTRLRLDVREVIRYESHSHNSLDFEANKVYMTWLFSPFPELGMAFRATKDSEHGLYYGWKPISNRKWSEGEWQSQRLTFSLGELELTAFLDLHYDDFELADGIAYIIVPRIQIKTNYSDELLPWTFQESIEQVRMRDRILEPLIWALKFTRAKRTISPYQVMTTYDPVTHTYSKLERYLKSETNLHHQAYRHPQFHNHWKLITEMAQAIRDLDPEKRQRIERAIFRYVTTFEAPFIEMQIVSIHSAIHILVSHRTDTKRTLPDDELPSWQGNLLRDLGKFITAKQVEWKDLIPDGREKEILFDFNKLRNAYLKELDHKIEEYEPFRIAHRLFERLLLADLGLDSKDYPALGDL